MTQRTGLPMPRIVANAYAMLLSTLRIAARRADENHAYGRSKAETID